MNMNNSKAFIGNVNEAIVQTAKRFTLQELENLAKNDEYVRLDHVGATDTSVPAIIVLDEKKKMLKEGNPPE